jgi:hypothetical protein
MARVMFPFSQAELDKMAASAESGQVESARKAWVKRGFFKDCKPMPRRQAALKAQNARLWLETTLHNGPLPAREVLQLAKLEGFSEWGVRRAKKYLRVKTVKTGGRQRGWGARWMWQPVAI